MLSSVQKTAVSKVHRDPQLTWLQRATFGISEAPFIIKPQQALGLPGFCLQKYCRSILERDVVIKIQIAALRCTEIALGFVSRRGMGRGF